MKSFNQYINEDVEFKKSSVHGKGAFSTKDIPVGTDVGLYLKSLPSGNRDYARSDLCRLTNHSVSPNMKLKQKGRDIYISSNRSIKKGEELLVNYFDVMEKIKPEFMPKDEFVRLYPDIKDKDLKDHDIEFYDDLKNLK
jgi:SET domain-containing protein